jgi:hypothetical protein
MIAKEGFRKVGQTDNRRAAENGRKPGTYALISDEQVIGIAAKRLAECIPRQ